MGSVCCGGLKGLYEPSPDRTTSQGLCVIALCGFKALYTLKCPEEVKQAVRNALGKEHLRGDGPSTKAKGLYKFKLDSWLWMSNGQKTVEVRRMVLRLIEELDAVRWEILEDVDMSRSGYLRMLVLRRSDSDIERPRHKDFLVGLHGGDSIRITCDDEPGRVHAITEAVRLGIESSWEIVKEGKYGGAHEFVLDGWPFGCMGTKVEDSVKVRRMLVAMCAQIEKATGYRMAKSLNLSAATSGKSSIIFRYHDDASKHGEVTYVGVSLNDKNVVRLISPPWDSLDETVEDTLRSAIVEAWPKGIQQERVYDGAYEWELAGLPWDAHGTDLVDSRILVGRMLKGMWSLGFELSPKIDCNGKLADMSLMVFRRPRQGNVPLPPNEPVLGVSLHDTDDIRITCTDETVVDNLEGFVRNAMTRPALSADPVKRFGRYGRSLQMKLDGRPFCTHTNAHNTLYCGTVLLALLDVLYRQGWILRTSLDVSRKQVGTDNSQSKLDAAAMYFTHTRI
ncbi:hypothetical protein Pmar_PMAR001282 [Perkinsus marinus ATCC 50983]|uniref:Uncharacterized protein n=1 Tax=Perkinsus marinus (strain ATCC 50983 / TXsc) TaxID=423536 RepID=C5KPH5_PERM5|nr:hypothetical protein Pmar_PMAR001282 [Perkinsus marinus ATCC 50983]EER13604.1 hypothetical protein Pmar_PMAR001282 [Perkinsus marinus ATCC 50983]|eukprot:XP_002781809.1 hypothetical protein Pmar_PMAR001282 [Perkinsus marinus ATCC 50983]